MKKKYITFLLSIFITHSLSSIAYADKHDHHHHHTEIPGSEISKKSIYLLDSKWKDQNNKTVQLKDFSGKHVIVSMLYTTCTKSCPIIMSQLKSIHNDLLSKGLNDKFTFLIISINPEKDTPKVLKGFEKKHKLDKNFVFLSGTNDSVLEIASLLGIRYVKTDEDYSHTNKILILNKKGEIIHQNEGLTELDKTKKFLIEQI